MRQTLVCEHSPRVEVRALIDVGIARCLLGRHVRRRAEGGAELGDCRSASIEARRVDRLGNPEVGDDGDAIRDQHVLRLDVAVHDALVVRVCECARDVGEEA